MKFKILCLLVGTFATHSMCLAGFTLWELTNERGRTNYVVEAELTTPPDYVTQSGMYFVSRYMKQVEFFEGSESLPWLLTDTSKGSFSLNLSSGNLYYINSRGRRFDLDKVRADTRRLYYFYAKTHELQTVDQTLLVRTFLKEAFLINEIEEDEKDHLHLR